VHESSEYLVYQNYNECGGGGGGGGGGGFANIVITIITK
jgi:hypothetical protein